MKKTLLTIAIATLGYCSYAQSIFPTDGSNVGIGTTSPMLPLYVNGTIYSATPISNTVGIGTTWTNNANYNFIGYQGYWGLRTATNTSYNLDVYNGGSPITAMTVLQGGNIGIGITAPDAKLDVNGDIYTRTRILSDIYGGYSGGNVTLTTNTGGTAALIFNTALTENMRITSSGNVGIGTATPDQLLSVAGTIHCKEVKVDLIGWPDYVFKSKYHLPTLSEVKTYIDKNHHLPDMPSEQVVAKDGINLGEMNKLLTKKVEELTLYLIKQQNQIDQQNKRIAALEKGSINN